MEDNYSGSEMDLLLYQYSQEHGGYFIGDSERGNYPDCQLILDQAEQPIVLSPIVTSHGRYGYGFLFVGRMQVELPYPLGNPIHTIKVFCNKGIWGESIYAGPIEAKDIECVAELCRETYRAVRRYPMPETKKSQ